MGNREDKSWKEFFEYFTNFDGSAADIAARFNAGSKRPIVTETQVRDWRRRHSRPHLTQLPELGHHWDNDQLFFARMLGAIPKDGIKTEIWLQRRLMELRGSVHELDAIVRSRDTTEATGQIVAAATASGRWAVAVHPAIEGPTGVPIHVADRLDFRCIGDSSATAGSDREQLETDLEQAFSRNHVVYSPKVKSTWATEEDEGSALRYAVAHTTANFGPTRMWDHVAVRSIAVVSLTLGTWPIDVAALVARMLGYGFVSTRALSRGHRPHGRIPTDEEATQYRADVHQDLAHHPWHRYVWGHVGGPGVDPDTFFPRQTDPGLAIIWLRESEELIRGLAIGSAKETRARRRFENELRQQQDTLAHASAQSGAVHEIVCESRDAGPRGLKEPRWDRTFEIAADIVEHLLHAEAVQPAALGHTLGELISDSRPDPINLAVMQWLRNSGRLAKWGIR
ncbi:hypothetical protein [Rhodococcus qingshengii]|uniref:hypothetical protein n=1 Tax=Rhodococcus qingshengii TaxID=334542 RepID=UPI00237C55D4|nr:hypothetical protein [Rhodococcus qingshengii]WCT06143.1 hypothetical protein PI247_31590 [Rhodococcus qingshengii]